MPGHRREYAGQFAMIEVDFWLDDPRITTLSLAEKVFFLYAWMIAVKERRQTLPKWWQCGSIGKRCALDPKTTAKAYRSLLEKSLLVESAKGEIIVCGVKTKHPNLKWKDGDLAEVKGGIVSPNQNQETETEGFQKKPKSKKAKIWAEVIHTAQGWYVKEHTSDD